MSGRLWIRGGRVVDPAQGVDGLADVLIEDGRIGAVGQGLAPEGADRHWREGLAREGADERWREGTTSEPADGRWGRGLTPERTDERSGEGGAARGEPAAGPSAEGRAKNGDRMLDATGLVVAPGFVDPQVHLCEPGGERRETIASGARAAAAGGCTAVCAMPSTAPPVDDPAAVGFAVAAGRRATGARVLPAAALSVGRAGEQLTEFGEVVAAGAVALADGKTVRSTLLMRRALEYAQSFGVPVLVRCEDPWLAEGGVMHEGVVSTRLGLRGKPAVAEEVAVARDVALAEATGGRLHVQCVSTAASCEIVRRAKERGAQVTAEATPHHLLLDHGSLERYGTECKVDPPLRPRRDVEALRQALAQGVIDCVATDHAPCHYDEKEQAFDDAPFGAVGLETAFAVLHAKLVLEGVLGLSVLIERMSAGPSALLGLGGGALVRGAPADIALIDPAHAWTVDPDAFASNSRNTPFAGANLVGRVVRTLVEGETVWDLRRVPT